MAERRDRDRIERLVRCARLYYEEHFTKSKIAAELRISGTHVKRLLKEAERRGIVRITVVDNPHFAHLEQALQAKFRLRVARVAPATDDYEHQKESLGQVAAALFDELVTNGTRVGIGGGGSLKAMIDALPTIPREIYIAPMALVGRGPALEHVDAAFLTALLYYKSSPRARASVVGMPPTPRDATVRESFVRLIREEVPEVSEVLSEACASTVVFLGLGGPAPVPELVPALERSGLTDDQRNMAAGGINYNYFDDKGRQIGEFFVTISLDQLRTMAAEVRKTLVVVAGGPHKIGSLRIALECGFANAIVTDSRTALRLLNNQPSATRSQSVRGQ